MPAGKGGNCELIRAPSLLYTERPVCRYSRRQREREQARKQGSKKVFKLFSCPTSSMSPSKFFSHLFFQLIFGLSGNANSNWNPTIRSFDSENSARSAVARAGGNARCRLVGTGMASDPS